MAERTHTHAAAIQTIREMNEKARSRPERKEKLDWSEVNEIIDEFDEADEVRAFVVAAMKKDPDQILLDEIRDVLFLMDRDDPEAALEVLQNFEPIPLYDRGEMVNRPPAFPLDEDDDEGGEDPGEWGAE